MPSGAKPFGRAISGNGRSAAGEAGRELLTQIRRAMGPHILGDKDLWERLDATE